MKMTTRTKLNVASFTSSTMMLLNVFSHPLGIPESAQWVLIIGVFVPLGLIFRYSKKLKEEKARGDLPEIREPAEATEAQKKAKRTLVMVWVIAAGVGLATPLWLPITGVSRGTFSDFVVGVVTVLIVSVIFGIRLKKMPNQAPEPTPGTVTPRAK